VFRERLKEAVEGALGLRTERSVSAPASRPAMQDVPDTRQS
jgi:hypothetical protein